jgi:hypothetical protein
MLTFFTTPKPFRGHIDVIQRNALRSWSRIHPEVEVIVFGDDEGAAEAARELGIRHEPSVKRNENGTKYLGPIYDRAQEIARSEILCYVNCDIILMSDFREAVERLCERRRDFMMIGRRWDLGVTERIEFDRADWERELRAVALREGKQRPADWIDYFVFSRGLYYGKIPPFVIGRPGWDNWLVWYARAARTCVVDASQVVMAVHQNHDYSYHPDGEAGVWSGEEARRNRALLRGWTHIGTMEDATHRLGPETVKRSYRHWAAVSRRAWIASVRRVLEMSLPMRHSLGLRRDKISALLPRKK